MTNKDIQEQLKEEFIKAVEDDYETDTRDLTLGCYECGRGINERGVADWWINKIAIAELRGAERERERIKEYVGRCTHYYRSKFSPDFSREETEEEKRTEMLDKNDVLQSLQQEGIDKE